MNVLDLTFYKFVVTCIEISLGFRVPKIIIIIIITLLTCELPLRDSQGIVATFYRCVGQS